MDSARIGTRRIGTRRIVNETDRNETDRNETDRNDKTDRNEMTGSKQYEAIEYETRGPIGLITLNRPDRLNAINEQMLDELGEVLDAIEIDDQVRVVVLAGCGPFFLFGVRPQRRGRGGRPGGGRASCRSMQHDMASIMRLWHFPKPTIAAAHGYAIAGRLRARSGV